MFFCTFGVRFSSSSVTSRKIYISPPGSVSELPSTFLLFLPVLVFVHQFFSRCLFSNILFIQNPCLNADSLSALQAVIFLRQWKARVIAWTVWCLTPSLVIGLCLILRLFWDMVWHAPRLIIFAESVSVFLSPSRDSFIYSFNRPLIWGKKRRTVQPEKAKRYNESKRQKLRNCSLDSGRLYETTKDFA